MKAFIFFAALFFGGEICEERPHPLDVFETVPDIREAERLPSRAEAMSAIDSANLFLNYLNRAETFADLWQKGTIGQAREEAEAHRNFWYLVLHIQSPESPEINRQRSLRELREMIGDEAYFLGRWPAAFPWWRLPRD